MRQDLEDVAAIARGAALGLLAALAFILALAATVRPAPAFHDVTRCWHLSGIEKTECEMQRRLDEIEEKAKEAADKLDRLNMCITLASRPSEIRDCHTFNF